MGNLDWLYNLEGRGSVLGLIKIKELMNRLQNPQNSLKCIHVAGTNGKGSTCAMTASILKKSGYKVGMYTSPHLSSFNERMQINGVSITDSRLDSLIEKVKPFVKEQTFFEVTTAIAFQYFYEEKVDYLVLEVGLGGRLDATNIITPLFSVITNIALEHTHILGTTIERIAYEKAGIIKENIPIVTLAEGEALKKIKKIAKENNCKIYIPKVKDVEISLKGDFQKRNAALAVKVCELMNISEENIKRGLKEVEWKGRFEFIDKNILVDCAHNYAGIKVLGEEIKKLKYEKIIAVVGILKDKDKEKMIKKLEELVDYIIFTKADMPRAENPEELGKYCSIRHEVVFSVKNALKKAKKLANSEDLILVTGSIFIIGEII